MAEVFGVVAGAAGLIPLCELMRKGIKTIKTANKNFEDAPTNLENLAAELEFLTDLAEILVTREVTISQVYPQGTAILRHCEWSCKSVVGMLDILNTKYEEAISARRSRKTIKKFSFRAWEDDVERLRNRMESAKQSLIMWAKSFQRMWEYESLTETLVSALLRYALMPPFLLSTRA